MLLLHKVDLFCGGQEEYNQGYADGYAQKTTGTVSYKHHVHVVDATQDYVLTDSASITTDGFADSYRSPTQGGCFTTPVYGTKTVVCGHYEMQSGDASGNYHYRCDNCGAYKYDDHGGTHYTTTTDYNNIIGYTRSCGHTRGQIIEAIITY